MKLLKYVLLDLLRNRTILLYGLLLLAISLSLFQLEGNAGKGLVSLVNIVLIIVPLVSLVFPAVHYHHSYEFISLLVAQPVGRGKVFMAEWAGLGLSLSLAFLVGIGWPIWYYGAGQAGWVLVGSGLLLTWASVALSLLASVLTNDRAKGIGLSLLLWLYFTIFYDGLVLTALYLFRDYPLEKAVLAMAALNPVDLGRIAILLQLDIAALMGFTGAIYRDFLGTGFGLATAVGVLLLWTALPSLWAFRAFAKKDL